MAFQLKNNFHTFLSEIYMPQFTRRKFWMRIYRLRQIVFQNFKMERYVKTILHVHREVEKKNQFYFVCIFFSTWQTLVGGVA